MRDCYFNYTVPSVPHLHVNSWVMPLLPTRKLVLFVYLLVGLFVFAVLLVPIFITHTKKTVVTQQLQYLRLDYCFGLAHHYNITITVVADDQQSGFATYACKKTYNQGNCDVRTPYRDISGGPANFVEVSLDGPQDYGPVVVIVRGDGRYKLPNNYILTASSPH